jgi:hypothetical protein
MTHGAASNGVEYLDDDERSGAQDPLSDRRTRARQPPGGNLAVAGPGTHRRTHSVCLAMT